MFRHYYHDSICTSTKIIPDRVSVHAQEGDFGAISVMEESCAARLSKVERLISDKFCALLSCCVKTYLDPRGSK